MRHLYHGKTSVCSAKVRVGLAELGLDWEGTILDLGASDQNSDWYLKINPKGVVPALVDDGRIVAESSVILSHLDRSAADRSLTPSDPDLQTQAEMWLADCIDIHAAINTMTFATTSVGIDGKPVPGKIVIHYKDENSHAFTMMHQDPTGQSDKMVTTMEMTYTRVNDKKN